MTESMPPSPEEIQQLRRRLNEQVLEQAAADPRWKQRFLDDPRAATAGFAESQRYWEMYESAAAEAPPVEATPATAEEYRQLQRSLWNKVLDKAASDPAWKQHLLDDPQAAMGEFTEAHRLREMIELAEMRDRAREEEVHGQIIDTITQPSIKGRGCQPTFFEHTCFTCICEYNPPQM